MTLFLKCLIEDSIKTYPYMVDESGSHFNLVLFGFDDNYNVLGEIQKDHCYLIEGDIRKCELGDHNQKSDSIVDVTRLIDYGTVNTPVHEKLI